MMEPRDVTWLGVSIVALWTGLVAGYVWGAVKEQRRASRERAMRWREDLVRAGKEHPN